ncbi:hypothetical protein ACH5RR_008833 [Cinchona calisaya]|uniref:Uncharacterized protein n=1 Tax=Cinchona calisaya TaxID=153742 RepID=A0ABD3AEY4_9GENT
MHLVWLLMKSLWLLQVTICLVASQISQETLTLSTSALHNREKTSNRSSKKHKLDDAPSMPILLSTTPNECKPIEAYTENEDSTVSQSESDLDTSTDQVMITTIDGGEFFRQHSSLQGDVAHGRLSNSRKPQHSHRFAGSQQSNTH